MLNSHDLLVILRVEVGVTEMAPVAIWATARAADHAAELSLVPGMANHRTKFIHTVSELTLIPVGAPSHLLPLVAELGLGHPLVEHFYRNAHTVCFSNLIH